MGMQHFYKAWQFFMHTNTHTQENTDIWCKNQLHCYTVYAAWLCCLEEGFSQAANETQRFKDKRNTKAWGTERWEGEIGRGTTTVPNVFWLVVNCECMNRYVPLLAQLYSWDTKTLATNDQEVQLRKKATDKQTVKVHVIRKVMNTDSEEPLWCCLSEWHRALKSVEIYPAIWKI